MTGRAFIHVGSPKTGTTFIHAVVWRSRGKLEDSGVRLPGPNLHAHFQAALDVRGTPGRARFPEQIDGAWGRLVDASRHWPGDLLISHELLASAPEERACPAVQELADLGYEPHIVLTARDLARQLPAEWQERIKHRSGIDFDRFIAGARDPETRVFQTLWHAQDYADIVRRWAGDLPAEQVHVVTVPPAGAPKSLLWERFAGVLGLDPAEFSIDVPRDNTSLRLEQALLLQQVNRRLGDRVPMPGAYTDVGKLLLAHQVLSGRSGTPLVLGGDDLDLARERSTEIVAALEARGVTVHGDLADLLVPETPDQPALSTARQQVPDGVLLEESLAASADLLAAFADRSEAGRQQRVRLREELQAARAELRSTRRQVRELEERLVPRRVKARRALGHRVRSVSESVARSRRRRRPTVHFLVFNGDGIGGIARTVITVANALAAHHDVEVVSVYRAKGKPTFDLDPRVPMRYLVPATPRHSVYPPDLRELAAQPSIMPGRDNYTAASDAALRAAFEQMRDGDVVVSTRPSLHPSTLMLAPDKELLRIGWEHLNFPTRYGGQGWPGRSIDHAINDLDAYVVLTEADAVDYRARHPKARVHVIRNAVPWTPADERGPHDRKEVIAAGRLTEAKGFDRLISAWALLQEEFPDWTCRIYGKGELEGRLRQQIADTGVAVELPGYTLDMRGALRRSALFAMSSRSEGFPMSLIEALAEGTPLVSFDCPRGPGEIVVDGSNGLLVPDGDIVGLADALATLMRDPGLRERMGEQALRDARQYDISSIARTWLELIEDVQQSRG
jgi:glycosyltransferase involved in cell wall biosynthesis